MPPYAIPVLDELAKECSEPNWDSYDAEPVRDETLLMAERLLLVAPAPTPDVCCDPDGCVAVEWEDPWYRWLTITGSGHLVLYVQEDQEAGVVKSLSELWNRRPTTD